jgi:hypothetical protein
MSMTASELGTVPCEGFKWYVIFVDGDFSDQIREQIDKHFSTFGKAAGREVLAVRGYDPKQFRESLFEVEAFYGEEGLPLDPPAIVLTNAVPGAFRHRAGLAEAKVMIFPLREVYEQEKGDISVFLGRLLDAIGEEDAFKALEKPKQSGLEKFWGWLSRYVTMKPGFIGFSADLNTAIDDIIAKAK